MPTGTDRIRADVDRPLTARGRADARQAAQALRERGLRLGRLATSPLMRAVQTAEIHAMVHQHAGAVESLPFLAQTGAWHDALEPYLGELVAVGVDSVALVGHNPDMSDIAARLAGADEGTVALPAGAVACFDLPAAPSLSGARLGFWLDPRDDAFHDVL